MPSNNATAKLILAFVTLLVGVVLIGSIASESNAKTDKTFIAAENISIASAIYGDPTNISEDIEFTITNYPSGWKVDDCPITGFAMENSTGTALTETTDYVFTTTTGIFTLVNSSTAATAFEGDNVSTITYTYCADDYLNLSWGRTLVKTVSGFFALALVLVSVGLFYSVAKDYGFF